MSAPTYGQRWQTYSRQWDMCVTLPAKRAEIAKVAKRLVAAKARYQAVEKRTGVPWYMIAAIHERESSQDWNAQLAQGDPLSRVSTHVPRGQGPYYGKDAWERAAIIALETDGLTHVKDWRLEKMLYYWEAYNGWGYERHGVPSPYVWGATTIQKPGKYVADGVWSSTAVDQQLGCAAMLKGMMDLDHTIQPIREGGNKVPGFIDIPAKPTSEMARAPTKSWWKVW